MPFLITRASGVNGDGYGALLAFDRDGAPLGVFCNDELIADPRVLIVHQQRPTLARFPRLHGQALVFFQ
jgi:hypothetical protein